MEKRKRNEDNEGLKKQKIEEAEGLEKLTQEQLPESSEIQGLTLYEAERQPLQRIEDDTTVTLELRDLNIDFTCPVCLGIIKDTRTMMECLHRFCSDCISKSLRLGKRECPTCRVKCSSQRNLRRDIMFDKLILTLYPNLEEYEAQEEKKIQKINENFLGQTNLLAKGMEQGKQRQAQAKKKRGRKKKIRSPEEEERMKEKEKEMKEQHHGQKGRPRKDAAKHADKKVGTDIADILAEEMAFMLLLHSQETNLSQIQNKFLRSSPKLTVRHLCKFLATKLGGHNYQNFRLRITEQSEPLDQDVSLERAEEMWKRISGSNANTEFALYYSLSSPEPTQN